MYVGVWGGAGEGLERERNKAREIEIERGRCKQGALKKEKKSDAPTYLPFFKVFEVSGLILESIFMVFLSSSCGETAKNAIKKS
jgi:hypothetical protein